MKLNPVRIGVLACVPALLISFQNCSKIGATGITVDEKPLAAQSVEVLPPAQPGAANPDAVKDPATSAPAESNDPNESASTKPGDKNSDINDINDVDDSSDKNTCDNKKSKEDSDDEKIQELSDTEIAEAVKVCADKTPLSIASKNLSLTFNHEEVKLDAEDVLSIIRPIV